MITTLVILVITVVLMAACLLGTMIRMNSLQQQINWLDATIAEMLGMSP